MLDVSGERANTEHPAVMQGSRVANQIHLSQ